MNEKLVQINSLLRFFKEILKDNKNLLLTRKIIYDCITKLDVSEKQYNTDIKDELFDKFSSAKKEDYSLSFSNKEEIIKNINTPIKIYIPLEYSHIQDGLNKILDFLNSSEIAYEAKLSKETRIDNIIVRLSSKEDADKLIKFVNSDEYIVEGLLKPNPFCFTKDSLALTLDSNLSYTSIVVEYIYSYLKSKDTDEKLEDINIDNFYNYIIDVYKKNFVDLDGFSNINFPGIDSSISKKSNIRAYQDITELILKVSEKNFNEEEFYKLFDDFNDKDKIKQKENKNDILLTLCYIIKIQSNKYGLDNTIKMIIEYINSGISSYISNDCSLRELVLTSEFRNNVKQFLDENNITIEDLINKLTSTSINIIDVKEIKDDTLSSLEEKVDNDILMILDELSSIYDKEQALNQLRGYIVTNDISFITSKNNLRKKVYDINLRSNLLSILYKKNISFVKYIENLNQKKELDAEITFEQAIINTYYKYEQEFEDGKNEFDGYTIVNYAINQLLLKDDYNYFTSDNDSRKRIKEIDKSLLFKVICNKLGYDNLVLENMEVQDIEQLIINYLDSSLPKVETETKNFTAM